MRAASWGRAAAITTLVAAVQPTAAQSTLQVRTAANGVTISQPVGGPLQNVVFDFQPPAGPPNGHLETIPGAQTGVFAGLPPLTAGTHRDLVFGPALAPPATPTPVAIFSIGGFDFRATRFGPGGTVPGYPFDLGGGGGGGGALSLSLSVRGTATGPGLAGPTAFVGVYSACCVGAGSPGAFMSALGSGAVVTTTLVGTFVLIPEPGTLALVAVGALAGGALAGGARRVRRRGA